MPARAQESSRGTWQLILSSDIIGTHTSRAAVGIDTAVDLIERAVMARQDVVRV